MGDIIKDIEEYIKGKMERRETPDVERYVFGIGIGAECTYKTVAEAFVARLYTFELDLSHAKNDEEKQRILDEKADFLNTYKQELLPHEKVEELLKDALLHSKQQEEKSKNDTLDIEARMNESKGFIALGKDYVYDVGRNIEERYTEVIKLIGELIEKEQDFLPE